MSVRINCIPGSNIPDEECNNGLHQDLYTHDLAFASPACTGEREWRRTKQLRIIKRAAGLRSRNMALQCTFPEHVGASDDVSGFKIKTSVVSTISHNYDAWKVYNELLRLYPQIQLHKPCNASWGTLRRIERTQENLLAWSLISLADSTAPMNKKKSRWWFRAWRHRVSKPYVLCYSETAKCCKCGDRRKLGSC